MGFFIYTISWQLYDLFFAAITKPISLFSRSPDDINIDNVYGILINTVSKWNIFGYKMSTKMFRHWYSIKKINSLYYNLDSQLKEPEVIGNDSELKSYLRSKVTEVKTELLLIVRQDVAEARSWEIHATCEPLQEGD